MPTNKQAVKILKTQIIKLEDFEYLKNLTWRTQTAEYVKHFFGAKSNQYSLINNFTFYDSYDNLSRDQQIKKSAVKAKHFLNDCIQVIENVGLYKEPKTNFLSSLNNYAILGALGAVLASAFTAGITYEKQAADIKNFELKQTLIKKDDTLRTLRFSNRTR